MMGWESVLGWEALTQAEANQDVRARDPFSDDVLERLVASNQDYQRTHGDYIVPLAERLLAARRERDQARDALKDTWDDVAVVLDQHVSAEVDMEARRRLIARFHALLAVER